MPHADTEHPLVEPPAVGLFAELGWQTVSAGEGTFGATGRLLTKGGVVWVSRLRAELERLNASRMSHHVPPEAMTAAKLFQLFTRLFRSLPQESESQPRRNQ